jgi:hypothetical protein
VAGDAEGEGLTGPGPPDHHRDADAPLADVTDHPLLILAGGGVGLECGSDGVM